MGVTFPASLFGQVRIDEEFYPIVLVRLIPHGVQLLAQAWGPAPEVSGPYRVFNTEGEAVTDLIPGEEERSEITVPALRAGDSIDLKINWKIDYLASGTVTMKDLR